MLSFNSIGVARNLRKDLSSVEVIMVAFLCVISEKYIRLIEENIQDKKFYKKKKLILLNYNISVNKQTRSQHGMYFDFD
jgi:hypothetical protein